MDVRRAFDFTGRNALITGAARGIGFACAKALSDSGARVALADMNGEAVAASARELSSTAVGLAADIGDAQSVAAMVEGAKRELGEIDIFVNCAAITHDNLFLESGPEDWERILRVDLFGAMLCLKAVLPDMVRRGYGRVVYLASDSALIGQARLSYYAAAKGGVVALIKSVAQEVGKDGVTLNVVSPGATNTPLRAQRETALRAQLGEERFLARERKILARYPVGRLGQPDDIAGAVAFLSAEQSSWVTGQVLSVNGGFLMA
ncbi:SDR family oxidoreductase [Bosea sp. (in: a-proteobacteria)]|uniref:SDR family NAD(P)-dependent oxidoreductase n=1 Tax=Bosea sp. (in: a-proteobacteria) TaxID=1871050 RepID=UPI00262D7932|nr:SDR family oxidoreductase [Bosea sp. (in: a-proteobacteria)]MCO5089472.1 SDR family oxidoreductase [Bosea sp. (in: a-proteobacteria)]